MDTPQASLRTFAGLLSDHPDAPVAAMLANGVFTDVPQALEIAGRDVMTGRSVVDMAVPGDGKRIADAFMKVREHGHATIDVHLRIDATQVVTVHFVDLREPVGVIMGLFAPTSSSHAAEPIATDIATRIPPRIGRVVKNEMAYILDADADVAEMLGIERGELIGQRSLEFIHPDDQSRSIENWVEMLAAPGRTHRVRLRHVRGDGTYAWVEITNENRLDADGTGEVHCELLDITQELTAQEALRQREELLARLAAALPLGVVQFAMDRSIVYFNDQFLEIAGVEAPRELDDLIVNAVDDDLEMLEASIRDVLDGIETEIETRTRTGRRLQVRVRPLTNAEGTVNGGIACVSDITDSARMREELHVRATFDSLTGCHNRASTLALLDEMLTAPGRGVSLVFVDLDHFKAVNDTYGHAAGDAVLVSLANRLRDAVRDGDIVGRMGGDEFVVVSRDTPTPREAEALATRLERFARHDVLVGGSRIPISATVGHTWVDALAPTTADRLVATADASMYDAKRRRRGDDHDALTSATEPAEVDALRAAMAGRQFEVHFQPVIRLADQTTIGFEALLRWRRGDQVVAAASFIEVAEKSGLIVELGAWIVDEVCRQIADARRCGHVELTWFINLSPSELAARAGETLITALRRHQVPPECVVVEVTEYASLFRASGAIDSIEAMRAHGLRVALDDFGTGWSSLSLLRTLAVDVLKIDREFTSGLGESPVAEELVRMIHGFTDRAGLDLVVEGIETDAQRELLGALGLRVGQGFLFSPARPLGELLALEQAAAG